MFVLIAGEWTANDFPRFYYTYHYVITMFGVVFISLICGFWARHFITLKTNPFLKIMNQPLISNLCHAMAHLISGSRALEVEIYKYLCVCNCRLEN